MVLLALQKTVLKEKIIGHLLANLEQSFNQRIVVQEF